MRDEEIELFNEIQRKEGLKGVIKKLEEDLEMPIPDGVCICENVDCTDNFVVIGENYKNKEQFWEWKKRWDAFYGLREGMMDYGEAKNTCSGNYIRGGD
jgi:hypothetical protein